MRILLFSLLACTEPPVEEPPAPGVDPGIPAAPGEARAGIVRAGAAGEVALFGGVTAEGRAGDIKLYNSRVQVVIQGAYEGNGYVDSGGGIIDLDLVRGDGTLGRDLVEDLFLAFGFSRLAHASSVTILADGSDGGAAVVESRGHDVPWKFIQGVFEYPEPVVPELGLDIVTTYALAPDSNVLSVSTKLTNKGSAAVTFTPQDGSFASGEDLVPWAPGVGFEGASSGAIPASIFTGRQGEATFSTWAEGLSVSVLASLAADLGIFLADHPPVTLEPGGSTTLTRSLAITADTASAEALRRAEAGEALAEVGGSVKSGGVGVAGARVHLVDPSGQVAGFAMTDAAGGWSGALPLGEWSAYVLASADDERVPLVAGAGRYGPFAAESVNQRQLDVLTGASTATELAYATGRATPEPTAFTLGAAGATVDLELPAPGSVRVELVDAAGALLPGVVDLTWASGAPPADGVPAELSGPLGRSGSGRAAWVWSAGSAVELPVLPGLYAVSAGHSWRHSRASATDVEVRAGEVTTVRLVLEEVVPRDGWLALDPHLHAAPSFDGALPMEDRLVTCAATGVELPVTTDHDAIADYRALSTAMGLDARLRVVPGTEVTTVLRGHYNLYPLEPAPLAAKNGGAEAWWNKPADTQELFDRMRVTAGPDALIQANHPRTLGLFTAGGLDPATGEISNPELWSWDFQTFELLNGGAETVDELRDDWFALLDFGNVRVPVGASDSHYRYIPCGLARSDIFVDTNEVGEVDAADVTAALRAGHVVVASGTTLRATATGEGKAALPGDTLTGRSVTVQATVRAPDWIQPGTLRIWVGGEVAVEETLPAGAVDGLWLDSSWTLDVAADTWVVVEVVGAESQGSTWRNAAPYAATNAFFVDTAGDGWTSPRRL
jgi:hypothetical protein